MSVSDKNLIEAAAQLYDAHKSGTPCAPVKPLLDSGGIADAYQVQDMNTRRALEGGRRLVGRKIGLTSSAVQRQLGVDQPDYGMLFADMSVSDASEIEVGRLIQPRAEAEIAFVLKSDLPHPDTTTAEIIRAIDFVVAALEIVDSRIADWNISLLDTVADNGSAGLYVLGSQPAAVSEVDLISCGMVMERRGEPVSVGAGRACLGSPISAATWLARTMAEAGRPLMAGDTILSGALGPMVDVEQGDVVEARISGLGSVTVAFAS